MGSLTYPDPRLTDGVVLLRGWAKTDTGYVQEARRDRRFHREGDPRSYLVFDTRRADALIYSLLRSDLDQ